MKVLEISARYPPGLGGVERHVSELTRALVGRGHEVTVWTSNLQTLRPRVGLPSGRSFEDGVWVERMGAWIPPGLAGVGELVLPRLTLRLRERAADFDVVHAHGFRFFPVFQAIPAVRGSRVPFVISSHASLETTVGQSLYDRWVVPRALRCSRGLICQTETEAGMFRAAGWAGPLHVIPPGVDELFRAAGAADPVSSTARARPPRPFLLAMGRLAPNKGLDILIRAAKPLLDGPNDLRLVIAGEDHGALPNLRRLVAELGLPSRVEFLGRVSEPQKLELLQRAELFAFPSVGGEAWGLTMFEALAVGCPVVASRLGEATELAAREGSALLADPGSVPDLRRCLETVLAHPELRPSWAQAGRALASRYSWDRMADATIEVLVRAAQGG